VVPVLSRFAVGGGERKDEQWEEGAGERRQSFRWPLSGDARSEGKTKDPNRHFQNADDVEKRLPFKISLTISSGGRK